MSPSPSSTRTKSRSQVPRKARGSLRDRAAELAGAAEVARAAAELGLVRKAQDVVLLDLSAIVPPPEVDWFVIMSSVSEPHQRALADHVAEGLEKRGVRRWHLEGYPSSGWILLDYGDVVVHIFRPQSRAFYALETLWGDARAETVEDVDAAENAEAPAERTPPRRARSRERPR